MAKKVYCRGEIRADGMVFWQRWADGREYWVTKEEYDRFRREERARQRVYHLMRRTDPSFRRKKAEYMREYRARRAAAG